MSHTLHRFYPFVMSFLVLTGCNGKSGGSTVGSNDAAKNRELIVGYWKSQNNQNDSFEFFPSAANFPGVFQAVDPRTKSGRVVSDETVGSPYIWDMDASGTIMLSILSQDCRSIPIDACPVLASVKITASGRSANASRWTISYDDDNDGDWDREVVDQYRYVPFDPSALSDDEFFLTQKAYYERPLEGSVENGTVQIVLDDIQRVTLAGDLDLKNGRSLDFSAGEDSAFYEEQEFFVDDLGYHTFTVKTWYDNVLLSSSASGGYALSYQIHRAVQVPENIPRKSVRLEEAERVETRTRYGAIVSEFIQDELVGAGDKFYSMIPLIFTQRPMIGGGNQIEFLTGTEGAISYADEYEGQYSDALPFAWVQESDGSIILTVAGMGEAVLRLIKPISGGYSMLFSMGEGEDKFVGIHDLLRDSSVSLSNDEIPGRFRFEAADGALIDVTFNQDGTVTSSPEGLVSGHWFQDDNGDVVSYECTDSSGSEIKDYEACYRSFGSLSDASFSHIRRLKFLNRDGNQYQVKYDAIVHGERFGVSGDDYVVVAQTYRWFRMGSAPD